MHFMLILVMNFFSIILFKQSEEFLFPFNLLLKTGAILSKISPNDSNAFVSVELSAPMPKNFPSSNIPTSM